MDIRCGDWWLADAIDPERRLYGAVYSLLIREPDQAPWRTGSWYLAAALDEQFNPIFFDPDHHDEAEIRLVVAALRSDAP